MAELPNPRSGLDEAGGWKPAFPGQRPPFEPGNTVGRQFEPGHEVTLKHGAYSEKEIGPLRDALVEQMERLSPSPSPADDHARRLLAGQLARIEIAERWIAERGVLNEDGELWPIVAVLPKWESAARNMLRELGLTTLSRAELGLDLAKTHIAISEAQTVIVAVYRAAARYVPAEHRQAFMADVGAFQGQLERRGEGSDLGSDGA